MTPKEFYKQQRKLGLTEHITCNSEPNYNELFYQEIFNLMENYHKLGVHKCCHENSYVIQAGIESTFKTVICPDCGYEEIGHTLP
jgi:hypothetical protein